MLQHWTASRRGHHEEGLVLQAMPIRSHIFIDWLSGWSWVGFPLPVAAAVATRWSTRFYPNRQFPRLILCRKVVPGEIASAPPLWTQGRCSIQIICPRGCVPMARGDEPAKREASHRDVPSSPLQYLAWGEDFWSADPPQTSKLEGRILISLRLWLPNEWVWGRHDVHEWYRLYCAKCMPAVNRISFGWSQGGSEIPLE